MPKKPKKVPDKVNPNKIKVRDYLLLDLFTGSTKSGFQTDRKKESNKRACRKGYKGEDS